MKKSFLMFALVLFALAVNAQRTPVKVSDLNKAIIDNVAKDYSGYTITGATKVLANNVTTYDVVIAKGSMKETLVYDKDGKFIKKEAPKMASAGNMKSNHNTTKSAPAKTPVKK